MLLQAPTIKKHHGQQKIYNKTGNLLTQKSSRFPFCNHLKKETSKLPKQTLALL